MASARDTPTVATPAAVLPLERRPHALYRFFNAGGRLLYVGITAALPTRLHSHNGDKPWWADVVDIKVEHFPDRASVLAAEKVAIVAEKPIHNVVHNRAAVPAARPAIGDVRPGEQEWTFRSRYGYKNTEPLDLYWEVHCDPISDDFYIDEIGPEELWQLWLTNHPRDEDAEAVFGPGAFRVSWYVGGPGIFEGAPFRDLRIAMEGWRRSSARMVNQPGWDDDSHLKYEQEHQFLAHYTWPVDSRTGEPLQWSRLPVIDKVWRRDNLPARYETKGGFIQEATGWKPAPLQPYVNVHQLARAARLYSPEGAR